MATQKNTHKSTRKASSIKAEPFAVSDEQFAADVCTKVLSGDFTVCGQSFEDEEGDNTCTMAKWLIAIYEDWERSQQPHVDAAIQYLDPSA